MINFTGDETQGKTNIVLATTGERESALAGAGITLISELTEDAHATKYEYHYNHDYIVLNVPDKNNLNGEPECIEAYLTKDALCVLCTNETFLSSLALQIKKLDCDILIPSWVLYQLFALILSNDGAYLENIEDEIDNIEEEIIQTPPKNINQKLLKIRKNLLALKRYYEALFDLLEDLEENQNGFMSKPALRSFRLHTNRVNRLLNSVINLRDYLGHVRELYQNQIDIRLNKTMQLLTVITVIFMPLTLIVGWYGMNLQMPEYDWQYSYPIVGAVSVLVIVFCLWYFRRKKWY